MIGYVGNLREHPLPVPAGRYYIESLRADGSVVSFGLVNVGSFGFSTAVEGTPAGKSVIDPSRAEQLTSLLEFLVDVERAKLTALSIASSGFTAPLFDTSTSTNGMVGLEDLYALYAEIAEHEQAVLSALDGFRAVASAGPKVAAAVPVLGVIDAIRGVKNELLGFFGFVGDAGQRMRERILRVSPRLGPDDKEEAFGAVPEATRGGATNFDELVGLLKNGDLDHHAAVIFGKLQSTSAAFNFEAQGVLGDRPGLAVAHEEGAELVTKGAELNAKIIRTVLAARFPDISDGFDLADKADAWAQYVTGIYTDPLGTLEGQARERVKERIADRIKVDLQSRFPDFSEALTEEIAEAIGEKVVGGIPEFAAPVQTTAVAEEDANIKRESAEERGTDSRQSADPSTPATEGAATSSPEPEAADVESTALEEASPPLESVPPWIEETIDSLGKQLLEDPDIDGITAAAVTETVRGCLLDAVASGLDRNAALETCRTIFEAAMTDAINQTGEGDELALGVTATPAGAEEIAPTPAATATSGPAPTATLKPSPTPGRPFNGGVWRGDRCPETSSDEFVIFFNRTDGQLVGKIRFNKCLPAGMAGVDFVEYTLEPSEELDNAQISDVVELQGTKTGRSPGRSSLFSESPEVQKFTITLDRKSAPDPNFGG